MILEFFSAFNTIQPALLREKLESAGVDCQMTAWTFDSPCCLPTGIQHNLEYRKVITDLVIWYELMLGGMLAKLTSVMDNNIQPLHDRRGPETLLQQ